MNSLRSSATWRSELTFSSMALAMLFILAASSAISLPPRTCTRAPYCPWAICLVLWLMRCNGRSKTTTITSSTQEMATAHKMLICCTCCICCSSISISSLISEVVTRRQILPFNRKEEDISKYTPPVS